jgi:hypothetical protein
VPINWQDLKPDDLSKLDKVDHKREWWKYNFKMLGYFMAVSLLIGGSIKGM